MSEEITHPFAPGTKVIVQYDYSRYGRGRFVETEVLKLHKTGRFTLATDPAVQWKAWKYHFAAEGEEREWYASKTERAYSINSSRVRLDNAAARAEMAEARAAGEHAARCNAISDTFRKPASVSHEISQQVLALLSSEPGSTKEGKI